MRENGSNDAFWGSKNVYGEEALRIKFSLYFKSFLWAWLRRDFHEIILNSVKYVHCLNLISKELHQMFINNKLAIS